MNPPITFTDLPFPAPITWRPQAPDTPDIEPTDPPIPPPTARDEESPDHLIAKIHDAHQHLADAKAGLIDEDEDHPRRPAFLDER